MQLPGRLRLTTLGDVLGALHRSQGSGVLELADERGIVHRVYWCEGMITQIETDLHRQRLGDLLAGQGFLGAQALARLARRLLELPRRRTGEILVDEGLASSERVSAGLRRQLRQKLDALFQLKDARLSFRVPRPHDAHRVPLSPGEFLHGRPRARPRGSRTSPGARPGALESNGRHRSAYAALGLSPGADAATVRSTFRRLASLVHPDRFPNADAAERARLLSRFAELSAAYHTLVA